MFGKSRKSRKFRKSRTTAAQRCSGTPSDPGNPGNPSDPVSGESANPRPETNFKRRGEEGKRRRGWELSGLAVQHILISTTDEMR